MKIFMMLVVLAGLATSLNACGRRGDPEPPQLQQAR